MKKPLLIFFGVFILSTSISLFQSCNKCDVGPHNQYLSRTDGEIYRITGYQKEGDDSIFITSKAESDSLAIRYDSLLIRINHAYKNTIGFVKPANTLGFTGAYACSPVENYDHIKTISITSSEDYNDSLPKGANLSNILSVEMGNIARKESVNRHFSNNDLYAEFYSFTFNFPPKENKVHNLTFKYILTDGREFISQLPAVKILK